MTNEPSSSEVPNSNSRESSLLHMEMMTLAIDSGTVNYVLLTTT